MNVGRWTRLVGLVAVLLACSSGGGPSSPSTIGVWCNGSTKTCSCITSNAPNTEDCSIQSIAGGACCASTEWPSGGSCDCRPRAVWTCATSTAKGCRCGASVTPTGTEVSTTSCSGGLDYVCCGTANECTCTKGTTCPAGRTKLDTCGGPQNRECASQKPVDSCRPGAATCPDKGYCSPNSDKCACGLACIHLAAGSYTCGESCFDDGDCKGKQDPQSGIPYSHCAHGSIGSFCS